MGYHIGEVAGFLGITSDTIRFYEKEGIINPTKNPVNGYREYGFQDISRLSDILFYRNVDFSIEGIKKIVNGVSSEEMLAMICEKELEVSKALASYQNLLIKMQNWEKLHREALVYENQFEVRPMPSAYRKQTHKDKGIIDIQELTQSIPVSPQDAYFVTLSFKGTLPGTNVEHYFALDTEYASGLDTNFSDADFDVETHPNCLFTVCKYQEDFENMLKPSLQHLKIQELEPEGIVYGRQSVVTYENDQPVEHYRIYIPLKEQEAEVTKEPALQVMLKGAPKGSSKGTSTKGIWKNPLTLE